MALLEIKKLTKTFADGVTVLSNTSISIEKGEVVVIEESFGVRVTEIIN